MSPDKTEFGSQMLNLQENDNQDDGDVEVGMSNILEEERTHTGLSPRVKI